MNRKVIRIGLFFIPICFMLFSFINSFNLKSTMKEQEVSYSADGVTMKGFIVWNDAISGKRPAILVVHEWWGLTNYVKYRARQLANLGYVAMAVDMYGDGKVAADPTEAQGLASAFYKDPKLAKTRMDAAIAKIISFEQTDKNNLAAIGYCFGGSVVLNVAKLGAPLKGVVCFHGGLKGVPANKDLLKAKILVCHGGSDKFVPQEDIDVFKHQLDSIGAIYTFKVYANATHAFTNPDATDIGKKFNMPIAYNPDADRDSWNDMISFFHTIFPH